MPEIHPQRLKVRDTRTHDQRLNDLRVALGVCKTKAIESGRVTDCSLNQVAKEANVIIDYFKENKFALKNTPGMKQQYLNFKKDVLGFQKKFKEGEYRGSRDEEIEELRSEIIKLKDSFHEHFVKEFNDKQLIQSLKSRNKDLEEQVTLLLSNAVLQQRVNSQNDGKVISLNKTSSCTYFRKKIVNPDNLLNGNEYRGVHKDRRSAAWFKAYEMLEDALDGSHPKKLYMCVGWPASGKSTWSESFPPSSEHDVIILDALNLTIEGRYEIWHRFRKSENTTFCVVYFDIPLSIIKQRNLNRTPQKQIPTDTLYAMEIELSKPDFVKELWIDEIKIIR